MNTKYPINFDPRNLSLKVNTVNLGDSVDLEDKLVLVLSKEEADILEEMIMERQEVNGK